VQQADDLVALAGVRQHQGDVVGVEHAQVAVDRAGGVEDVGAGAVELRVPASFWPMSADLPVPEMASRPRPCPVSGTAIRRPGRTSRRGGRDQFEGGGLGADDLPGRCASRSAASPLVAS